MKNFWYLWVAALSLPNIVSAHAFGQKYTLPLPVWLYIYGGGVAIIVSFLLIAYFTTNPNPKFLEKSKDLSASKFIRFFTSPGASKFYKSFGLFLFLITIVAGFVGRPESTLNLAPTMFWIIFMLGLTYLSGIIANVWMTINPVKTLSEFIADKKVFDYPKNLAYVPALCIYVFIIWLELLSNGAGANPQSLALYLTLYAGLTIIGVIFFGVEDWFAYGDFFSIFFGLIGKLAPIGKKDGKFVLRWPFVGLLDGTSDSLSLLFFIAFMLSSTAFDGFHETIRAYRILIWMSSLVSSSATRQIILLIGVFGLFLLIYLLAIWFMKLFVKISHSTKDLALWFSFSLIPIALAYNLAHYFTLLLVQGQQIISLVSDPFNRGWSLFGTNNYAIHVGIIGAKAVWQSQVAFILIGHIAAVYISHILALRIFKNSKNAFVTQLPMLVVMVCYTMAGLWILSQPLTLA